MKIANTPLATVSAIVQRLAAASALVAMAQSAIPHLVNARLTAEADGLKILNQIAAIRTDIIEQLAAVVRAMESIQDRVEVLGQFLLLHRRALKTDDASEIERLLGAVKE